MCQVFASQHVSSVRGGASPDQYVASAADLKSLTHVRQNPIQGLQIENRHWNHKFASALCFPNSCKMCAAMDHELRKAGTRWMGNQSGPNRLKRGSPNLIGRSKSPPR